MKLKINLKQIYIFLITLMAIPSIVYLITHKTILNFDAWFTFFLRKPQFMGESIIGAICFGIVLISLFFLYFCILKKQEKEFKTTKQFFTFIIIVTILFAIMLPFTTSDIFYYMGTGRLDSKYHENPYYTTVRNLRQTEVNDDILNNTGPWEGQIVVYGPLWALICKALTNISR